MHSGPLEGRVGLVGPWSSVRRFARGDFARYGFLTFVSTSLSNVLGYAFHFFSTRLLGVQGYGELSALLATLVIALVPASILIVVVVKYAAEFRALGDTARLKALVRLIVLSMGTLGLFTLGIGVLLSGALAAYLHIADRLAVVLTVVMIAFGLLSPVLRAVLQGVEDFVGFSISMFLESIGKAGFGVGLVYLGFGIRGALVGWAIGLILSIGYTYFTLWRRFRDAADGPLFIDYRRLALTSTGVAITVLFVTSLASVDVLMVKHYFNAEMAGLYSAAALTGKMLLFLVGFVPTVMLPMASHRAASGGRPLPIFWQAIGVVVVFAGSGLFLYATVPAFVVGALAGKLYATATPLVLPYGTAMVLLALLNAVINYKMAVHRFDYIAALAIVACAEVAAIALWHDTLLHVVEVLIVGNGLGLLASLHRIGAPLVAAPGKRPVDAAAA